MSYDDRAISAVHEHLVAQARKPARWATYRGDCRGNVGQLVGPTYDGREVLHIVTEDYDPAADRTRIGFAFGVPQTTTARERGTHTVVTDGQDAVPRRAWSSANNPRT